jgi:hypothetical protein
VADFETWDTPRRFRHCHLQRVPVTRISQPRWSGKRLRWLNDNGLGVVSMLRWRRTTNLEGCRFVDGFATLEATTVQNRKRQVWEIKALQPTR